jgi:hypothetical protein
MSLAMIPPWPKSFRFLAGVWCTFNKYETAGYGQPKTNREKPASTASVLALNDLGSGWQVVRRSSLDVTSPANSLTPEGFLASTLSVPRDLQAARGGHVPVR